MTFIDKEETSFGEISLHNFYFVEQIPEIMLTEALQT